MKYLSAENAAIDSRHSDCMKNMLFEFNIDKMDYYLSHKPHWITIDAPVFRMKIGEGVFDIPSGSYVLIGDSNGEIDWIKVDEMIDRDIECVTLDDNMATWNVDVPVLQDYHEDVFYWPMTHHAMPIVSNGRLLLVSTRDQHHRTCDNLVSIFLGH